MFTTLQKHRNYLTGEEEAVYGDSGYLGAEKRSDAVVRNKSGHKSI